MVDLNNVAALLAPWESDPWGKLRPPLSLEALRLSGILAGDAYRMDVEGWLKAGWRDVTIQVDGELTDGLGGSGQSPVEWLSSAWKLYRVRKRIRQRNPISQVLGTLRQKEKSDTGKVLVMIHPAPLGRYVVAIAFMGTGERIYDWISNFRMTAEGGFHKGFMQLACQFEENEGEIDFPETAKELGLEKLTLRNILQDAQSPNSRFTLWLCGHSQGGALMQVYMHRKIHLDGVQPRNLVGYGFASPTVMTGCAVQDPGAYPMVHVINSDDVFPRMGAQVHLGMCLVYPAGEELRHACYAWVWDEKACQARAMVEQVLRRMTDTPAGIEVAIAYLNELGRYTADDVLESLGMLETRLPLKGIFNAADQRLDKLLRYLTRRMAGAYASICGHGVSKARIAGHQALIAGVLEQLGLRGFTAVLGELISQPHRIALARDGRSRQGAYPWIVLNGVAALKPAVWQGGALPSLVFARRDVALAGLYAMQAELVNRRRQVQARYIHRNMRYADPRSRTSTRHRIPVLEGDGVRPGERIVRVE